MKVTIRSAKPSDAIAIAELLKGLGYKTSLTSLKKRLAVLAASPSATLLVAVNPHASIAEAGQALGLATLSFRDQLRFEGPIATLDELVVKDAARGRGIGRVLCTEALRVAKDRGALRLSLLTDRSRESYIRGFYTQFGFHEDAAAHFVFDL